MTRLERPSLTAVGLAAGLAVATAALPAHADGAAAVQVFPQAASPYVGTDPGLAFPGARPPQSRLLVPAPPGSLTPPARPTPSAPPPRTAAPKPQKPAPAKPATAVAQPKPAPKPAPAPVPAPAAAPEPAAPVVAAPAPTAAPEPAPAPPPPAPAPAPASLGPDQAPQEDLVARERTPAVPAAEPPAAAATPAAAVAPPAPTAAPVAPTPAPAAAPAAAPVPPAAVPEALTIAFVPAAADPAADIGADVARLAAALAADPGARVRLNAYAPGGPAEESSSRRLSLSRALAVRAKLVDAGVASTRIEVRALGNRVPEGPADRVDVIVLER